MPSNGPPPDSLRVGQRVLHITTLRPGVIVEMEQGLALVQFDNVLKRVWCVANKLRETSKRNKRSIGPYLLC